MKNFGAAAEDPPSDFEELDVLPFLSDVMIPRSYQLALLEKAKKENSIVYLETRSGKTHIAVMLLLHIADIIRKPSSRITIFLCPNTSLVQQQEKVVEQNTDLEVGTYYGEMNIDAWKSETWKAELEKKEDPRHCFMRMDCIELLIFDECHYADKQHPCACIMEEFYHPRSKDDSYKLPRVLGLTASPFHGKEKLPYLAHSPSIPDAFSGTWARGLDGIELHAYAVSFEANHKDKAYVNFGLFLESDLGPEAGTMEVELQLSTKRLVIAKCSPCGTMVFDRNQLGNAKLFQESVFSALLDRKPGIGNSGDWSPDRLYLLLPLKEKQESSHLLVDWDSIEKVISDVKYFSPDGVPSEIPGSSLVRLSDGYVPVNHVTNSLVQTMHNKADKEWIYCARERIPDLTAESPMIIKGPKYSSYSDYYEGMYNTRLKFVTQPKIESQAIGELQDERSGADEELVQLPLELCRIRMEGLSCPLTNAVSLLPSFMHRLEGLLLALQLRRTLPLSHPGASPVPAHLMLEAITTNKCGEDFSLEVLELLGDAFLEVSVSERLFLVHKIMQVDELTNLRRAVVCNATLMRLGKERGLMNYIRDSQFSPEDWAAPGRSRELCAESLEAEDIEVHPRVVPKWTKSVGTPLPGKTIADVFEALIGAHYIHGGVDAAQAIMGWLGCEIGVDPSIKEEARKRVHGQVSLLPEIKVAELEKLLNYKFENKGLLVEAMTHASSLRRNGDCYQRLEFLGESVLGFLITRHFYEKLEPLKRNPGLLTDLRSATVLNNDWFARAAVRHNLHFYLLHSCREMTASVEKYVKFVHDSTTDAECHGWKGESVPKEQYFWTDYHLDRVWNVFHEILKPLVTPETLRLEPTHELLELCQKQKLGNPRYKIEDGTKGAVHTTVTVQLKNAETTITGGGRNENKKSAKKSAAEFTLLRY